MYLRTVFKGDQFDLDFLKHLIGATCFKNMDNEMIPRI